MNRLIRLVLAFMLFLCLLDMPYGFYQLVRFLALVGFAILAYQANEKGLNTEAVIFISLAIVFQPIIKISFGRSIWNVIDVIVGLGLVLSIRYRNT